MKKKYTIFVGFLLFSLLVLWAGPCFAWSLNAEYIPNIPLAPKITSESRLTDYVMYLFAVAVYIAGALAVLSLVISGIQLMMSAENPSNIGAAKERMKNTIIGLFLVLGAVVIAQTISLQFTHLGITLPIIEAKGLHLSGPGGETGAPMQANNLSEYEKKYDKLIWPKQIKDINGETYENCDDEFFAYMVFFYSGPNLTGNMTWHEIKCGDTSPFGSAQSYVAVKERPGVYFYSTNDCSPSGDTLFNGEYPETAHTSPIMKVSEQNSIETNIRSVRIINGPYPDTGPFYGVVLFTDANFASTSGVLKGNLAFRFDNGFFTGDNGGHKGCSSNITSILQENIGKGNWISWNSALIYQRAHQDDYGNFLNPGDGVSLWSSRELGVGKTGRYCPPEHPNICKITGDDFANSGNVELTYELSKLKISPLAGSAPDSAEQAICPYFDSSNEQSKANNCFKSMTISGNYLVLLSACRILNNNKTSCATQAFPQKKDPQGPPDLQQTLIGPANSKYIQIIPLASPIWQ